MPTGLVLLGRSPALVDHHVRRVVAFAIDVIVFWLLALALAWSLQPALWPTGQAGALALALALAVDLALLPLGWVSGDPLTVLVALFAILFFSAQERLAGLTLGKRAMNLRVTATAGPLRTGKVAVRSLAKSFWAFLLVDWLVGLATRGDPRQRGTDRLVGTTVARTDAQAEGERAFEQMVAPPPRVYEAGNYPYVAVRARAKKTALYRQDTYMRLLQMDIPQIARFLGESDYKPEILALGARKRGVDLIERATADNLARVFPHVLAMCEGGLREMVAAYLERWDVVNIKTILRGKLYGAGPEEIVEDLVAAGSLGGEYLRGLARKATVEDVFESLEGTIYVEARRAMGDVEPAKDLAAYEDTLSHVYYRRLLASIRPGTAASRIFRDFVRAEIDILNLKTLLRVWKAKAAFRHPIFLEGGRELAPEELQEMVGLDEKALLARLARTTLYEQAGTALREAREKGVASVERTLEKLHLKAVSRHSHFNPASVIPVLDFLASKTVEVENLRIIARGKEQGIPSDAIRELLVI